MMTLTYSTQRSIWTSVRLNEKKNVTKLVKKFFAANEQIKRSYVFEKILNTGCCLPLSPGYIHEHHHDYHFQTSSLELLGQSKPNFMWGPLMKRERKFK